MTRVFLTIVLPLLLPTALYVFWLATWGRAELVGPRAAWPRLPWIWLALAGVALVALTLVVLSVGFGRPADGIYVPPHVIDGRVVPGHVKPAPAPRRAP